MPSANTQLAKARDRISDLENEARYARRFASIIESILRNGLPGLPVSESMLRIIVNEYRAKYPKER